MMSLFPLIEKYFGVIFDADITNTKPGEALVIESPRRLRPEQSYGYVHSLFGIFFTDGMTIFSALSGCLPEVTRLLQTKPPNSGDEFDFYWLTDFQTGIDSARSQAGLPPSRGIYQGRLFARNKELDKRHPYGD